MSKPITLKEKIQNYKFKPLSPQFKETVDHAYEEVKKSLNLSDKEGEYPEFTDRGFAIRL